MSAWKNGAWKEGSWKISSWQLTVLIVKSYVKRIAKIPAKYLSFPRF
jgi:hypothetical protein